MKSLADIKKKATEKKEFKNDGEGIFLKVLDGESFGFRFLQEIDVELADERRGHIIVEDEHVSPANFRLRGVCSLETESRCWACEQITLPEIGKKWRPKMRFYANVAILTGPDGKTPLEAPKVKVLAQGFGKANVGALVIEYAEEYTSLMGQEFKITRNGAEMNDTSYLLTPRKESKMSKEIEALELIDLTKFVKYLKYDEQAAYYAGTGDNGGTPSDW